MHKITEIWAFVVEDDDGDEGIPAFEGANGMMFPLIGSDLARVKNYREVATSMAKACGKSFELRKFTQYEVVETIPHEER